MTNYNGSALLVSVLLGCCFPTYATETAIQPGENLASPAATSPAAATQAVTFAQRPAQVGDRVAQTLGVGLQIRTKITQAGQQAHQGQTEIKRRQQRFIEVLEIAGGNVRRAHVTYPLARVISPENDDPEQELVQPVEKKSYFVTREGKRLLVTDVEGDLPTQEEFEIVVTSLQNLGLPSPLVKFLLGKTIHVGERLQLPQQVAEQLMGLGNQFGEVKQFELELKSVERIDEQPCAVFAATIEAVGEPANPVRVRAFGQVVIQTETCRTVRAELSGPLSLSTAEHTPAGSFQYSAQGSMKVAIQSKYGQARK